MLCPPGKLRVFLDQKYARELQRKMILAHWDAWAEAVLAQDLHLLAVLA
jgi:hypothetical protein